ncbi:MAG: hypothetical protein V4628_14350 [Pseudomonadota bacterium]
MFYAFAVSTHLTQLDYNWEVLPEIPGLSNWYQQFAEQELARRILADNKAATGAVAARLADSSAMV